MLFFHGRRFPPTKEIARDSPLFVKGNLKCGAKFMPVFQEHDLSIKSRHLNETGPFHFS
jgi:hypothetical protein